MSLETVMNDHDQMKQSGAIASLVAKSYGSSASPPANGGKKEDEQMSVRNPAPDASVPASPSGSWGTATVHR
jgi:hypothetical protein